MELKEKLHKQVWERFVRMPYGHVLDYSDMNGKTILPDANDCKECMPNALGWGTSIENGAFFTGLYATALLKEYEIHKNNRLKKEIKTLINGLRVLQDVGEVEGFIARGVAEDGVSHYPLSSEDQVVPWIMGMYSYFKSDICMEKDEIRKRLLRVLISVKNSNWRILSDIKGVYQNDWSNADDWRGVCKMLYCSRLIYELTGDIADFDDYRRICRERPNNGIFTRLEILSNGFSHDMVYTTQLIQFWINVCSHLALIELEKIDSENVHYYNRARYMNGVTTLKFIADIFKYDNNSEGFDINWKKLKLQHKPFCHDSSEAVKDATEILIYWKENFVPHRYYEHEILGNALFGAWIAVTCGNEMIRDKTISLIKKGCNVIDWDTVHLSYAFVAESVLIYGKKE